MMIKNSLGWAYAAVVLLVGTLASTVAASNFTRPSIYSSWDDAVKMPDRRRELCRVGDFIGTRASNSPGAGCSVAAAQPRQASGDGDPLSGIGFSWIEWTGQRDPNTVANAYRVNGEVVCAANRGITAGLIKGSGGRYTCSSSPQLSHILIREPLIVISAEEFDAVVEQLKRDVLEGIQATLKEDALKRLYGDEIEQLIDERVAKRMRELEVRLGGSTLANPETEGSEITVIRENGTITFRKSEQ